MRCAACGITDHPAYLVQQPGLHDDVLPLGAPRIEPADDDAHRGQVDDCPTPEVVTRWLGLSCPILADQVVADQVVAGKPGAPQPCHVEHEARHLGRITGHHGGHLGGRERGRRQAPGARLTRLHIGVDRALAAVGVLAQVPELHRQGSSFVVGSTCGVTSSGSL
ncbi:MAG: hypothetical protein ACRDRZ_01330 [Pseudonocardiaceae bacterium]